MQRSSLRTWVRGIAAVLACSFQVHPKFLRFGLSHLHAVLASSFQAHPFSSRFGPSLVRACIACVMQVSFYLFGDNSDFL